MNEDFFVPALWGLGVPMRGSLRSSAGTAAGFVRCGTRLWEDQAKVQSMGSVPFRDSVDFSRAKRDYLPLVDQILRSKVTNGC